MSSRDVASRGRAPAGRAFEFEPLRMQRVAIVAPRSRFRSVLALVADAGVLEPELATDTADAPQPPTQAAPSAAQTRDTVAVAPRVSLVPVDPELASRDGRADLIAGEREIARVASSAVTRSDVTALLGWTPVKAVIALAERLAPHGGAVAELPSPRGIEPPTALPAQAGSEGFRALVDTYTTVPYRDVDPTWFAAAAYVLMFGMMFGDVGDGLLLATLAVALRRARGARFARMRSAWALALALGVSAAFFGLLYGEAFGPTGLVPVVWISPLAEPVRLLEAAIAIGAGLLAVAYGIGTVNRVREGGLALALYAPGGIAGTCLFVGLGGIALGVRLHAEWLWVAGTAVGAAGLALAAVGLRAEAGPGAAGVGQAAIELFDLVLRLGSNLVSFARLAAFGLTHAALGSVVWNASTALWNGGASRVAAVAVFVLGHVVTFALEALVAGVQALRLEYYELFSRLFVGEGRVFRPWHVPLEPASAGSEEEPL